MERGPDSTPRARLVARRLTICKPVVETRAFWTCGLSGRRVQIADSVVQMVKTSCVEPKVGTVLGATWLPLGFSLCSCALNARSLQKLFHAFSRSSSALVPTFLGEGSPK